MILAETVGIGMQCDRVDLVGESDKQVARSGHGACGKETGPADAKDI